MNPRLQEIAERAYSSLPTILASYNIAAAAIRDGVPGDLVECGVAAGANAAAMALAIDDYDRWELPEHQGKRKVHLFDSFTGIPQCGPEDKEFLAAGHKAGLTAHSRQEVERNLREWGLPLELFVFHEGMFDVTTPKAQIEQIAVLRLDGDLYESTKVCLDHLYWKVVKGGWIIMDDWDLSGARKAVLEHVGHGFGPIYFQRQHV